MAKRVFISFRLHEKRLMNALLDFFQDRGGPVQATPAYMRADFRGGGEERITAAIREQMKGCAGMIFLAGDDAHDSGWMQYEGGVANEFRIPKVGIRHPESTGGFPNAHAGVPEVPWDPKALAAVIAGW